MHAVMISFQVAGAEDKAGNGARVFPPCVDSMPGLLDSRLLMNGARHAWFLLFRDRGAAELALRSRAVGHLNNDSRCWDIFVEQFDAVDADFSIPQPELDPSLLLDEQPSAVANWFG